MGQVDISLDPGPGCELGGIIGWRTKQGRRGLGHKGTEKANEANGLETLWLEWLHAD